jgi:hypothetical protein
MDKNLSDEMSEARKKITGILGDLSDSFRHISESAERLGHSTFFGNDRLHTSANMLKDGFVKKTLSVSEQFHDLTSHSLDRDSLMELHDRIRSGLKEVKKTTPKQAVFLSRYFKKDSGQVVDNIKKAEENLDSLKGFIDSGSVAPGFSDRISGMISEIKQLKARSAEGKKETEEMKDRVVYLKKLKQEKEDEYLELLRSREWKKIKSSEKDLSEIREDSVRLEMDIRNELSALRRPMKKLEYSMKSKSGKETLKRFLSEPFETYIMANGKESLMDIIKSLSDAVISGEISLKDSDKDRITHFMKKGEKDLSEIRSSLLERREEIADIRKKIGHGAALMKKKEDLEEGVKNHTNEMRSVEESIKKSLSEMEDMDQEMEKRKKEIEQLIIEKTGKMIRISAD